MTSDPVLAHLQALRDAGVTSITIDGQSMAIDHNLVSQRLREQMARDPDSLANHDSLPTIFAGLDMPFE